MAGAGYKLFTTGSVLTAAEVNTYLQEQTVMVFADATARTTALSGVVAEGMLSYLKDTDVIQYYNGSSWTTVNTDQTPLTTKGDLFTYSTADARLAVGSNGETLVADSSATTGLRWSAGNPISNPVINGGMDIWQRGTSTATTTGVYTADRWLVYFNGTGTVTRQATSDTTNLPFIQYCARIQRTAGQTTTNTVYFSQSLESVQSIPFAGKTVTLSFYARAGANFSASSSQITTNLNSGTGTDQNIITGTYTGNTSIISQATTLTTTWQRFTYTGTVATTATELSIYWQHSPSGTAGAADYYEITGVQLDIGSVALPFRRAGGTLAGELAACQRYYLLYATDEGTRKNIGVGSYYSATQLNAFVHFPVQMRTAPTLSASSGTDYYGFDRNSGTDTFNSFTIWRPSPISSMLYNSSEASGTAGQSGQVFTNNSLAVVAFSAEL